MDCSSDFTHAVACICLQRILHPLADESDTAGDCQFASRVACTGNTTASAQATARLLADACNDYWRSSENDLPYPSKTGMGQTRGAALEGADAT